MPMLTIPVEQVQVGDVIEGFTVRRIAQFGRSHARLDQDDTVRPDHDDEREYQPKHRIVRKMMREEERTYKVGGATHFTLCFSVTSQLGTTLERGTMIDVFRKAAAA